MVVVAVLASALVAGVADAAPTGLPAADLVWRVALGALVPLAAARAGRAGWVVGAAVGAAFAPGAVGVVALVAFAAALASTLRARRDPAWGAVIGAVVANAALRLDVGGSFHGAESLLAAGAVAVVVVSALCGLGVHERRRAIGVGAITGGALLVLCLVAAVGVVAARGPLEQGLESARAGLDHARDGDIDAALDAFARAEENLGRGVDILGAPWMAPARLVPVVGQHLAAASDLSATGHRAVDAAGTVALVAADDTLTIRDGRVDLAAVAATEPPLARALAAIDDAVASIDSRSSPWLVPALADRFDDLRDDLVDARGTTETAVLAARTAPGMLGADGPRTYLILLTTPAETRNLGGFVGNWALVTADEGRLDLSGTGRANQLSTLPGVEDRTLSGPEDFLRRYVRYSPAVHMVNVTASPDFPTVGAVSAELFPQAGIGPVDGVVALDPAALSALLALSGPVSIPQLAAPLDARALERFLLVDQYDLFPDLAQREDMLDALIATGFQEMLTGTLPGPSGIIDAVERVVAEDRMLLWSPLPDEAELLDRAGVSGAFPSPDAGADLISVRTANAGPNKLDVYLSRRIAHEVVIDPLDGDLAAAMSVTLRNDAPEGLSAYATGEWGSDLAPGDNRQVVSLYTAHLLDEVRVDGVAVPVESQRELGWNVYTVTVVVGAGTEVTIEWLLFGSTPARADEPYRLVWSAQPVFRPDQLDIEVRRGARSDSLSTQGTVDHVLELGAGADPVSNLGP